MKQISEKKRDAALLTISITAFNLLVTALITPLFLVKSGCNLIPIFGVDISNCSNLAQNSISNFELITFIESVQQLWVFFSILMLSMFIVFYFNLRRKIPSKRMLSQLFFSFKTIAQAGFLNIFMTAFIVGLSMYFESLWKGASSDLFLTVPDSLVGMIAGVFEMLQAFVFIYLLFTPLIVLWSILNFGFCSFLFRMYYYFKIGDNPQT